MHFYLFTFRLCIIDTDIERVQAYKYLGMWLTASRKFSRPRMANQGKYVLQTILEKSKYLLH